MTESIALRYLLAGERAGQTDPSAPDIDGLKSYSELVIKASLDRVGHYALALTYKYGAAPPGNRPFKPEFAFPAQFRDVVTRLLDERFGPGRAQLRSMSSARAEATDEFHGLQIREKLSDPNSYSNYGAFLKDKGVTLQAPNVRTRGLWNSIPVM